MWILSYRYWFQSYLSFKLLENFIFHWFMFCHGIQFFPACFNWKIINGTIRAIGIIAKTWPFTQAEETQFEKSQVRVKSESEDQMFLHALPVHSFMEVNALRPSEFPGAPRSIAYYAGAHWTLLLMLKIERTDSSQGPRIAPSTS